MAMADDMTASDILRTWDLGEFQTPTERALTLLACGFAERSREELARLSIGQRDGLLFELRERLCGQALRGFADCPACGQRLRFTTQSSELRVSPREELRHQPFVQVFGEWVLHLRLPDSQDLLAAAACDELAAGRELLIQRCVVVVQRAGVPLEPHAIPPELFGEIAAPIGKALAERDPQAEVILALVCPSCAHGFPTVFDIATFLWTEVKTLAQRLLSEVDALARVYGWSESAILAMSETRRRRYLHKVGHE